MASNSNLFNNNKQFLNAINSQIVLNFYLSISRPRLFRLVPGAIGHIFKELSLKNRGLIGMFLIPEIEIGIYPEKKSQII